MIRELKLGSKVISIFFTFLFSLGFLQGCTTLPDVRHQEHKFPHEKAYVGTVDRPFKKLGIVKSKVNFPSLDPNREETDLCRNYYNKAVKDLVKMAKEKGADAVVDVRSVVFFGDGRSETYQTPECADDGQEGQILTQGIAIKWPEGQN